MALELFNEKTAPHAEDSILSGHAYPRVGRSWPPHFARHGTSNGPGASRGEAFDSERRSRDSRIRKLAEDVFDFVEDRGAAFSGLVVHFERRAELLDEFALLARQLGGRHHAHVIVQVAFAAAVGIGQAFAAHAV